MLSKHVLVNREANSRHAYDVRIWLSRTTDNSNIFTRSHEVRDNESRLYLNSRVFKMIVFEKHLAVFCFAEGKYTYKYYNQKVKVRSQYDQPVYFQVNAITHYNLSCIFIGDIPCKYTSTSL